MEAKLVKVAESRGELALVELGPGEILPTHAQYSLARTGFLKLIHSQKLQTEWTQGSDVNLNLSGQYFGRARPVLFL